MTTPDARTGVHSRWPVAARCLLLAVETVALAFGIRGWWLFGHWNLSHPEAFFSPVWIPCALAVTAAVAWFLARRHGVRFEAVVNLPLLVLLLQPFKPRFFLTNSEILPTLPFALGAGLVLRCYLSGTWPGMTAARHLLGRFLSARPGPQARLMFIASLLIYLFLSSNLLFPVYPFTGDEPHYLILTHSIVHEADTNLYDNYYVNKDYKLFYPGELEAHTHARDRIRQQSYSNHMPGAALALVPFYWPASHLPSAWMLFLIRFGMNFYTAVLVAQAFLLMRRVFEDSRIALAGAAFLALTPPLIFYSRCVYPEVFAGLLMIIALRIIIERRTSAAPYLPASLALAAMPWFGTKYAIFAVAFTIVFGILRLREGQHGVSTYVVFLVPLVLSAAALLLFLKHFYGEYSPEAIYHPPWNRPEEPVVTSISQMLLDRSRALLGYFYDQRIGLLVFAPAYLLAFPGAFLLWRRRPREASVLMIIAVFYTLFYAYNMSWGGQAPPSRPMVSITPLLATFVAAFLVWCRGGWRTFRTALLVTTALFVLILLRRSDLLYDTISNHNWQGRSLFLTYLSNPYVNLTRYVPQFLEQVDFNYAAVWIWLAILASIVVASLRGPASETTPIHRHVSGIVLICAGTFSLAVTNFLEPGFVLWRPPERVGPFAIHRLDSRSYPPEAGGFWTRGGRTTQVVVEADGSIGELSVSLSPLATNQVTFRAYNRELLSAVELSVATVVPVPLPWTYRWHDKQLYCLTIGTRRAATPKGTGDSRSLGVFVQLRPPSGDPN